MKKTKKVGSIMSEIMLIINFVGLESVKNDSKYDYYYDTTKLLGYKSQYPVVEFKFNTSWDWIMPVVEKLHSQGVEFTINDWGTVSEGKGFLSHTFVKSEFPKSRYCYETLLEATYENVVKTIKLINNEKSK